MAILVTGAAGFIGSHLVEALAARTDEPVLCIDNFCDAYDPRLKRRNLAGGACSKVRIVEGDVADGEFVLQIFVEHTPRLVFHLAAHAGVRRSFEAPAEFARVNVAGTVAVLEAARQFPVDRLVFASSSTVYGAKCPAPFREDAQLGRPLSPYGATKQAAESLCFAYHAAYHVPVVAVRPFSVYGPRIRPDLALTIFADRLTRGEPIPVLGDGSAERDFTHVSDVVAGLLSAAEAPAAVGRAINLGHDEPISVRRAISLLAESLGAEPAFEYLPAHPGDLPRTQADLTLARDLLGWSPRVGFREGVADFAAWYQANRLSAGGA